MIATGGLDQCRRFSGDSAVPVVSPHQVLNADYPKVVKALVLNEGRGQAGLTAAEMLLAAGVEVEIVTSDIAVAADLDPQTAPRGISGLARKAAIF